MSDLGFTKAKVPFEQVREATSNSFPSKYRYQNPWCLERPIVIIFDFNHSNWKKHLLEIYGVQGVLCLSITDPGRSCICYL